MAFEIAVLVTWVLFELEAWLDQKMGRDKPK